MIGIFRKRAARLLFPVLAVIGTVCMGFAFGQNDLANCASPGLSAYTLIANRDQGVALASEIALEGWMLLGCGILLVTGMGTRNARRVTRAEVNTGSMSHNVALYAPRWCVHVARFLLRFRSREPTLAPSPVLRGGEETRHYDSLRACVILGVSASVIATASSFKMPVSTTYVAFACVIASGAADRILQRGDSDLKLGRTVWVIFSWFAAAAIAAVAAGLVCKLILWTGLVGMLVGVSANLAARRILARRGEAQDRRVREQARERMSPEDYTEYEG
jgi:phosphate/sulfate permease